MCYFKFVCYVVFRFLWIVKMPTAILLDCSLSMARLVLKTRINTSTQVLFVLLEITLLLFSFFYLNNNVPTYFFFNNKIKNRDHNWHGYLKLWWKDFFSFLTYRWKNVCHDKPLLYRIFIALSLNILVFFSELSEGNII